MSVSVDPSSAALLSPAFMDELDGVGLLLPNAEEAAVLSGEEDAERAALGARRAHPGSRGDARAPRERSGQTAARCAGWCGGRSAGAGRWRCAEGAAAPLDTTGAGDAFAAGFLTARLSGAGPEEALRDGCRLAAVAVRTLGARPA